MILFKIRRFLMTLNKFIILKQKAGRLYVDAGNFTLTAVLKFANPL